MGSWASLPRLWVSLPGSWVRRLSSWVLLLGFAGRQLSSPFAGFAGRPLCDFCFDPHLCLCFCCLFGCRGFFFFRGVVVNFFKGGEEEEEGYLSFLVFLGEFH